jgi:hypothetical protein
MDEVAPHDTWFVMGPSIDIIFLIGKKDNPSIRCACEHISLMLIMVIHDAT